MTTAAALARLPVQRALAGLALDYLAQARAAALRLGDPRDGDALHDVRVALRRLHSLLRAYREDFGRHVPAKQGKVVRRLARATNAARDTEVQRAWLSTQAQGLRPAQREGYDWLLAQLQPPPGVGTELARGVLKLHKRLRPRLRRLLAEGAGGECYAAAAARRAQAGRRAVLRALAAVDGPHAVATAHAARIAVKRLRYLLAPLGDQGAPCATAVQRLRQLQELLGELHDRHVLAQMLSDAAARCAAACGAERFAQLRRGEPVKPAAWRPPELPGLLALAARNEAAALRLYRALDERYLAVLEPSVAQPLAAAVDALRAVSCPGFRLS